VIAYLVGHLRKQRSADAGAEGLAATVKTPTAACLAKGWDCEAYRASFGAVLHCANGYALSGAPRGPMER